MESPEALKNRLVEHVLGAGKPTNALLNTGTLPGDWVEKYLALLERVVAIWREQATWPREIVGAVHFASFYLNIRYDAWRSWTGGRNAQTEAGLARIRGPSELFLLAGIPK